MTSNVPQTSSIKPFDGSGFSNWEFRINLILEQASVLSVLSQTAPAATSVAELNAFTKNDVKARNILVQCLSDNVLELIKGKTTAKEIIETLRGTYCKTGIATQVQLQRKLRSLKYIEGTPLNSFITEFEHTVFELKAAGGKLEENEVSQLLSSMPESFQGIVTALDVIFTQDQTKVTLEFVKNKLLMEEARQTKANDEKQTVSDAVFVGHRGRRNYRNLGNRGNFGNRGNRGGGKFVNQNNEVNTNIFPYNCYNCGKRGHRRVDCTQKGRGFEQNRRWSRRRAYMTEESNENSDSPISFLTTIEQASTADNLKINFVIDSGATHHLVQNNFSKYITDSKAINYSINLAKSGSVIKTVQEGNMEVKIGNQAIIIKNVWVCDGLFCNLLSVRKLEEAGLEVLFRNNEAIIKKGKIEILKGKLTGNLYTVTMNLPENETACATREDPFLMHRKMGHTAKFPSPGICDTCMKGKQIKEPYCRIPDFRKPTRILETISSDVCGPINPTTHDGNNYYVSFIDHYSHFCVVYLIARINLKNL